MKPHAWIFAFALFGAAGGALAQQSPQAEQQASGKLELKPGFTTVLEFGQPVRTLAIGNPDIADVSAQSDRTFLLKANRVGETNLIAINDAGRAIYRATLLVGGGEIGRLVVHSLPKLHEYWTYRCTEYNCQRFDDKFERQPVPPIFVVPAGQSQSTPDGQTAPTGKGQ